MSIFSTVPVKKPKMSAFDLSYNNYFTCDMGELIPAFVLPIVPSDRIEYTPTFQVRFAPMLNPVFADIYAKVECFFVPYRLVWDNWKDFITGVLQNGYGSLPTNVPIVRPNIDSSSVSLPGCRLVDYLGGVGFYRYALSLKTWPSGSERFQFNCLPFRAYTLIWNEYYRDEFVDKPCMYGSNGNPDLYSGSLYTGDNFVSLDFYGIFRRRWQKDYFTTATPNPQFGAVAAGVDVSVTGSAIGSLSGFFSVAQFRVANSLQKFLERTNIGGGRYNEFILAHFGCMPTDATIQRPEFLGSVTAPVQVMAVNQTNLSTSSDGSTQTRTAKNTLGSQAGQMSAVGTKLCFRRSFKEYGVILGLFSVFPKPVYSDGISRYLAAGVKGFVLNSDGTNVGSRFDFGFPEFAGVGDQQIDKSELNASAYISYGQGFGYQQRYAEFKFNSDQVHGDFALTDSGLAQYTFARFFASADTGTDVVSLNSSFLECTPRADCFVTQEEPDDTSVHVNQCWVQLRNNVRAIRPFPKFSTPTL